MTSPLDPYARARELIDEADRILDAMRATSTLMARRCAYHRCRAPFTPPQNQPKKEFCSLSCFQAARRCPDLACADERLRRGWDLPFIHIGRYRFKAFEPEGWV